MLEGGENVYCCKWQIDSGKLRLFEHLLIQLNICHRKHSLFQFCCVLTKGSTNKKRGWGRMVIDFFVFVLICMCRCICICILVPPR